MPDSRAKGRTAELKGRDELRKLTGLTWERIPASGALDAKHGLKGDLYIPLKDNRYCVEVKHYKDDHLTSKLLTGKNPQLIEWWNQTNRQAKQVNKEPLLLFKYDRSKWFVAYDFLQKHWEDHTKDLPCNTIIIPQYNIAIQLLTTFCKYRNSEEYWVNA